MVVHRIVELCQYGIVGHNKDLDPQVLFGCVVGRASGPVLRARVDAWRVRHAARAAAQQGGEIGAAVHRVLARLRIAVVDVRMRLDEKVPIAREDGARLPKV